MRCTGKGQLDKRTPSALPSHMAPFAHIIIPIPSILHHSALLCCLSVSHCLSFWPITPPPLLPVLLPCFLGTLLLLLLLSFTPSLFSFSHVHISHPSIHEFFHSPSLTFLTKRPDSQIQAMIQLIVPAISSEFVSNEHVIICGTTHSNLTVASHASTHIHQQIGKSCKASNLVSCILYKMWYKANWLTSH